MTNREYIYDTRQLRYTSQNVLNAQEAVALVVPVYLNLYRPFYIRAETSLPYTYILAFVFHNAGYWDSMRGSVCPIQGIERRVVSTFP